MERPTTLRLSGPTGDVIIVMPSLSLIRKRRDARPWVALAVRAMTVAIGAGPSETWRRFARRRRTWRMSRYGVARIAPASVTRAAAAASATTRVTRSANGPASISANRTVPAHASRTGGPAT